MAIKLLYYFIALFIAVTVFLLYQEPYVLGASKTNMNKPNIEMVGVMNYSISEDGVSHIAKATKVLRFSNYDKFYTIDITKRSEDNMFENLKADSGKLVKDDLTLKGDVRYSNSNSINFKTEQIEYNLKTEVAKTNTEFILKDNRSVTSGASLVYKSIEGKIFAKSIKTVIKKEE